MANQIVEAMAPFVWGAGGAKKTPEEIAREREIAAEILMKAGNTSPVGHWTQGAARVVDALGGVIKQRRAEAAGAENTTYNEGIIKSLLGGGAPAETSAIPASGASAEIASTGPQSYRDAIAGIESAGSGDYAAIGPTNKTLGRPLGRYQVMEANLGPWSQEALGRAVTPDEFLASPEIQDAIFDKKFGSYVEQFGPEGAAQAWFAGPGGVGKVDRQDVLGTSVGEYGSRFASAVGSEPQQAIEAISPTQGGSLTDEVAAFEQTPAYSEQFPGQVPANAGLRPFQQGEVRPNADGSYSTEITTTWQLPDGSWVNVPSLWMGANGPQQFEEGDEQGILGAMQAYEAQNGPTFQRFGSEQDAVSAAQARSNAGGAAAGQQAVSQAMTAQPVQAQQPVQMAGGGDRPAINEAIIRAITDPRATPQTRAIAQALLQQQQAQQQQAAEQQQWMARQQYEQQAQQNDPMRQLQLEEQRFKVDALRNPQAKVPDAVQALDLRAQRAGLQPGTPEYNSFMVSGGKEGTNITVNTGESDKFYENLDKKNAEMFSALSEEGVRGRGKLAQIDRLESLMAASPQGAMGALKQAAGEYGINTEGLSDIQSAQALINELVPQQRQPGSGPMSDADLALFKQSLPRVINQPGGNEAILQTMRGITQYQIQMGEIADAVADRTMKPEEARKAIRGLENPLDAYTKLVRQRENDDQDEGWNEVDGVKIRKK